jgi:PAS domain S-box-containing protein
MDFSFNYFETLFNNAQENIIIILNREGTVIEINTAFTRCFGYGSDDIIGKNFSVLYTPEDQEKQLPEKELDTVLKKGRSSDNNYLVHKNKNVTWVSGESVIAKNKSGDIHILKIIQDIHSQKTAENNLRSLNDFNDRILASIDDIIIVLDGEMKIIKANKAFDKVLNYNKPGTESLNFADVIKPYDIENRLLANLQNTITTRKGFLNNVIELETASGDKRIYDVNTAPMPGSNSSDSKNILVVIHDITIHEQMKREREDIIGFVAHELRNPLGNVVLCNEIMSEAVKENNLQELEDLLIRSKNNVARLNKMIGELYDTTRLNSGNFHLEISEFNFEDMVKEAIETIEVLQPAYNIVVKGNGNILVQGDRYRLIQVMTNYLGNGIKYSNGKTDVTLTMQHDENSVVVSVKDEGLGISKSQLPYIFDRFFRAEKTRNIEGMGLGLYLCRQIIGAHNGRVWAESEEGKGSTFYFSIPVNYKKGTGIDM